MQPDFELTENRLNSTPFWLYFIAFTAAELVTALLQPFIGIICHGVILSALLVQSAFISDVRSRNFTTSLSLVPLVRIMSLIMPLASVPLIYWYILIYAPLLIAAVVVMRTVKLKPRQIGLVSRGLPLQIAMAIVTGIAFGVLEYYILKPQPLVAEFSLEQIWPAAIIILMTTGLVEEFIFRGVLQQTSEASMGRMGLVYTSAIFAILHIGHLSVIDVAVVFAIALFFAAVVKRTGSLIGVILSHGLTNIFLFLIGPFILS